MKNKRNKQIQQKKVTKGWKVLLIDTRNTKKQEKICRKAAKSLENKGNHM